ncbi:hypothetical protein HAX54_020703 [Datura stramonium]|uniref:Uncharacterized protein n=1 Tax=Datura stramonium TaxID=4076 RepID=A0ABS8UTY2_DATST|nr:hypothetical protein [Datura stramonium]
MEKVLRINANSVPAPPSSSAIHLYESESMLARRSTERMHAIIFKATYEASTKMGDCNVFIDFTTEEDHVHFKRIIGINVGEHNWDSSGYGYGHRGKTRPSMAKVKVKINL